MSNFKIKYDPNSNIISAIDDYCYCGDVFIFHYEILRCETFAEVRIWCDQCSRKECIYTCDTAKTDVEIITEVNEYLDNAIGCYIDELMTDPYEEMPADEYCDCMYFGNRRYQRGPWCD